MGDDATSLADFLAELGLTNLLDRFQAEDIDMSVLPDLDREDLRELGLTIGQRKKLAAGLEQLHAMAQPPDAQDQVPVQLRRISVLFCDMVGSTELGEKFSIDEMQSLLQHYYEVAHDVAELHRGHVYGTQGDGVIILFGYPRALEGFAERCVQAAVTLQKRLAERAITLDGHDPVNIVTRIGIATGQAAVGQGEHALVGEAHQLVGPVVNRAARFQTVAHPRSIAVDQKTRDLTNHVARYAEPEQHDLKGLPTGVQVHHLRGMKGMDDAEHAAVTLIGRRAERAGLQDLWDEARTGRAITTTVTGDAGIGKSTLVDSFVSSQTGPGQRVIRLQCTSMGSVVPLQPVVNHLEKALGADASTSALARHLICDDPSAVQTAAQVMGLDGVQGKTVSRSDRDTCLDILADWIINPDRGPSLLVVENAQWADDTTRALLRLAADRAAEQGLPIMLMGVSRDDDGDIWSGSDGHQRIALAPLQNQEARKVLQSALGDRVIPQSIRDNILKHSAGNPLMLETLGRAQSRQQLSAMTGDIEVPQTIYDSVSKRLDGIRAGRVVVEALAVLDDPVSPAFLAAVSGQDTGATDTVVNALAAADLVVRDGAGSTEKICFRHQVYRDVIYEQITGQARQNLHGAAYTAFVDFEPDIESERPGVLAIHASAARAWQDTSRHATDAGEALLQRSALIESTVFLDMAQTALARLPADTASNRLRLRVATGLASVERSRNGIATDKSAELGQWAADLARELGDSKAELLALNGLYAHALVRADYPTAETRAAALLDTAERSRDKTFVMIGTRAIGAVAFHRGDFAKAVEKLTFALDQYDEAKHLPLTHAHGYDHAEICAAFLAMSYWMLGDLANAHGFGTFAIEHSRKIDHAHSLAQAMAFRVMCGALARDDTDLAAIGAEAEALGDKYDIRVMRAAGRFFPYVTNLCLRDVPPRGGELDTLEELLGEFLAVNPFNYGPLVASIMATVDLRAGRIDRARERLDRAARLESRTGETWTAPEVMRVNALVLDATGDGQGGRQMRETALARAMAGGAATIALRIACDMARIDGGKGALARVQTTLKAMTSADVGWDIQRARRLLQTERRA